MFGLAANLTDEQKDLLRLLVSQDELHRHAEFLPVRSPKGAGPVYRVRHIGTETGRQWHR